MRKNMSRKNLLPESDNAVWLTENILDYLKPKPLQSISEYADGYLQLPPETSFAGTYTLRKTPYAKDIMDEASPLSATTEIILCSGTQMVKTQAELNIVLYYIEHDPTNILFVQANKKEMNQFVTMRIKKMIEANEELKKRVTRMTLDLIEFPGGSIKMGSGEAANSLKSISARVVILDEYDGHPDNVEGQGSGKTIAEQRTATYGDRRKVIVSSTPTNSNSKILKLLESTDKRHYFVKCPHCGKLIEFKWENFRWEAEGEDVSHAWYECPECGGAIEDYMKEDMLQADNGARWIPTNENRTDPRTVGFWIPGLYSPFRSWRDIIVDYLKAKRGEADGDYSGMTSFYNNILALPYEPATAKPDYKLMMAWARSKDGYYAYRKEGSSKITPFPKEILFLTSGADVQGNRIEAEVKGWRENGISLSIYHDSFYVEHGKTIEDLDSNAWTEYREKVLDYVFIREDGLEMKTTLNALDRSHVPNTVNAFWEMMNTERLVPVRGVDSQETEIEAWTVRKVPVPGTDRYTTYRYRNVGVSALKSRAYASFRSAYDSGANFIAKFPCDYEEDYFKQLTAERYVLKAKTTRRGALGKWEKDKKDRNEALDMHVYNLAMWFALRMYTLTWDDYEKMRIELEERAAGHKSGAGPKKKKKSALVVSKPKTLW